MPPKTTKVTEKDLLMLAETLGRMNSQMQWLTEFTRTLASRLNLELLDEPPVMPSEKILEEFD